MTAAVAGFDDVAGVVVVGFALLEDGVAGDAGGFGVSGFVGVEADLEKTPVPFSYPTVPRRWSHERRPFTSSFDVSLGVPSLSMLTRSRR